MGAKRIWKNLFLCSLIFPVCTIHVLQKRLKYKGKYFSIRQIMSEFSHSSEVTSYGTKKGQRKSHDFEANSKVTS